MKGKPDVGGRIVCLGLGLGVAEAGIRTEPALTRMHWSRRS